MSNNPQGQESEQGKQPVQMLIRLWHGRSNAHSEGNEDSKSRAQMLVEDVLGSTLEAAADHYRDGYVCASGINNLGRTLAASRALQEAFEGLRLTVPSGKTAISVVIDRSIPGESDALPSSPSLELTSLLDITRPGQVLITQAFYKLVDSGQPLQLRSFPGRAGTYEWVWTSGERLDRLQSDPDFRPTLVGEPRRAAKTAATALSQSSVAVGARTPKVERSEAGWSRFHIGNLRALHKVAAAVALAVAAGAGAGLWYMRHTNGLDQPGRAGVPSMGLRRHDIEADRRRLETEMVRLGPEANIPLAGEPGSFFPSGRIKASARQACAIEGQIPVYLALAEKSRNMGLYDAAIRQYNQVLACEPANREARQRLKVVLEEQALNPAH